MVVCVDVDCTAFQDKANVMAAVIAWREFLAIHARHLMFACMILVVNHAVYPRLFAFVSSRFPRLSHLYLLHSRGSRFYLQHREAVVNLLPGSLAANICC